MAIKLCGLNGINTDGSESIDPFLRRMGALGYETLDAHIPKRNVFNARWTTRRDAESVAKQMINAFGRDLSDVALVAHSRGCLLALYLMRCYNFQHVFLVAPAVSRTYKFAKTSPVTCLHSTSDRAILLGTLLFWHPFGSAGRRGFADPDVENIEFPGARHSDYFRSRLSETCAVIMNRVDPGKFRQIPGSWLWTSRG